VFKKLTSYIVKPISWIFNSSSRRGGAFDKDMLSELDETAPSNGGNGLDHLPRSEKENVNINFSLPDVVPASPLASVPKADAESVRKRIMGAIQRGEQFTPDEFEEYSRIMQESLDVVAMEPVLGNTNTKKRPLSPSVSIHGDSKRVETDRLRGTPSVTSNGGYMGSPASVTGTPSHHVLRTMDRFSTPLFRAKKLTAPSPSPFAVSSLNGMPQPLVATPGKRAQLTQYTPQQSPAAQYTPMQSPGMMTPLGTPILMNSNAMHPMSSPQYQLHHHPYYTAQAPVPMHDPRFLASPYAYSQASATKRKHERVSRSVSLSDDSSSSDSDEGRRERQRKKDKKKRKEEKRRKSEKKRRKKDRKSRDTSDASDDSSAPEVAVPIKSPTNIPSKKEPVRASPSAPTPKADFESVAVASFKAATSPKPPTPLSGMSTKKASPAFVAAKKAMEESKKDANLPSTPSVGATSFGANKTPTQDRSPKLVSSSSKEKPAVPLFSVGAAVKDDEKKSEGEKPSSSFSFGASTTASTASSGFSFGGSEATKDSSASTGFSFVAKADDKEASEPAESKAAAPTFSFGGAAKPKVEDSKVESVSKASTPSFSFGGSSAGAAPAATSTGLSFGAPAASKTEDKPAAAPSFSFGGASASSDSSSAPAVPSFGGFGAAAASETPAATPSFSFGGGASTSTTTSTSTPAASSFVFGDTSKAAVAEAAPAAAPSFSFGGGSSDSTASKPGFSFGNASTSAAAPVPSFGASTATTTSSTSSFSFGGGSTPAAVPSFGASSTAVTPAAPSFGASSFGGGGSSFGAVSAPAAAPSSSGFSFGGGGGGGAPTAPGGFSFGGSSTPAPAPAASAFGGGGGGMGGGAVAAAPGGFSFGGGGGAGMGAPAAMGAPAGGGGGFSFGGGMGGGAPAGGMGGMPAGGMGGGMAAGGMGGMQPAGGDGGGFSAGVTSGRKIVKARRRTGKR
jgi:hypothetical protein